MKIKKFKISYNELKALARFYDDYKIELLDDSVINRSITMIFYYQVITLSKKLNQRVNLHRNKEYNFPLDIVTSSVIYMTIIKVLPQIEASLPDPEKAFIIRLLGECEHVIINHKINIE